MSDEKRIEAVWDHVREPVGDTVKPVPESFRVAYRQAADEGKADEPGGMEYWRVFAEWTKAGQPDPYPFICWRANAPVNDFPWGDIR